MICTFLDEILIPSADALAVIAQWDNGPVDTRNVWRVRLPRCPVHAFDSMTGQISNLGTCVDGHLWGLRLLL